MARKVQLKNKNGEKAYPVTSSELVKMSSGGGNLDGKLTELEIKTSGILNLVSKPAVSNNATYLFRNTENPIRLHETIFLLKPITMIL